VGGVSAGNWGGTVKRTNTENFQPPENKLVSEQLFDHATNSLSTSFYSSSSRKAIFQVDKNIYQRQIQCAQKFPINQALMPINQMPIKIKN
jgi:hypothetical protein